MVCSRDESMSPPPLPERPQPQIPDYHQQQQQQQYGEPIEG